jgi:hypothetical protein
MPPNLCVSVGRHKPQHCSGASSEGCSRLLHLATRPERARARTAQASSPSGTILSHRMEAARERRASGVHPEGALLGRDDSRMLSDLHKRPGHHRGAVTGGAETAENDFRNFRNFRKRYANQGPHSAAWRMLSPAASSSAMSSTISGSGGACGRARQYSGWRLPSQYLQALVSGG